MRLLLSFFVNVELAVSEATVLVASVLTVRPAIVTRDAAVTVFGELV